jgi:hypothetical protein
MPIIALLKRYQLSTFNSVFDKKRYRMLQSTARKYYWKQALIAFVYKSAITGVIFNSARAAKTLLYTHPIIALS